MELLFLGTGAADWKGPLPSGEERRLSAALVDGTLLLDGTPRARELMPAGTLPAHVCLTHHHDDHFSPALLQALALERKAAGLSPLAVHVQAGWAEAVSGEHIEAVPFTVMEPFMAGAYEVLPVPSNHIPTYPGEVTVHLRIRKGEKAFLYATDGAWMRFEAVQALKGLPLDALVIDTTIGDGHPGDYRVFEHNSLPMVRIMAETFRATGMLRPEAPVILTHMARTLHPDHAALAASLEDGFLAAYDGLTVEI